MYFIFKAVECPVLGSTMTNGKVSSCGKFYRETCTFTCNENYHIVNEVATSKKLECLIDGHWNQGLPSCVGKSVLRVIINIILYIYKHNSKHKRSLKSVSW